MKATAAGARFASAILLASMMADPARAVIWYACKDCPDSSTGYNDSFYNSRWLDGVASLPTVTVIGNAPVDNYSYFDLYTYPGAWTYLFVNGVGSGTASQLTNAQKIVNGQHVFALCTIGRADLARTVSTADEVARADAIRPLVGLYALKWAATVARAYLMGSAVIIGGVERVAVEFTFADGGTEKWYINPLSSDNAVPAAGTRVEGNGVAQNVPCGAKPSVSSIGRYPTATP